LSVSDEVVREIAEEYDATYRHRSHRCRHDRFHL
jgi:hypothetical protein